MKIAVKQHLNLPPPERLERLSHLLLLLPEPPDRALWQEIPHGEILKKRRSRFGGGAGNGWHTDLPNAAGTRVAVVPLLSDATPFARLTAARRAARVILEDRPREVGVMVAGLAETAAEAAAEAAIAALLAGAHAMPDFKTERKKDRELATIQLFGLEHRLDLRRTRAEAEGNNLARYLTALPPSQLTPAHYRSWVSALAKQHGWKLRIHDLKALQRKKAGAFLAVAQGSADQDAAIVQLRYEPPQKGGAPLALVGKGICYDTGGLNLKPARHMHGMHGDMAGSAVALGTLLALTELEAPFPVECWLALTQNNIGPSAYRQNDVITAADGTTIEVIHTDAEGRLVLADTLVLATRNKPRAVIDYATLTGSCVDALGNGYSGAFSNRDALLPEVIAAGEASGERVWPFPLPEEYDTLLESRVADIKQCTLENEADHILAGRFLRRFVPEACPWLHLDLSAATHKGGLAHIPTEITGFGVRFTLNLLLDRRALERVEAPDGKTTS